MTVPITDMFVQSLQAQAVKAAGDVLNALNRGCLLDLCAAWPRLLKMVSVVPSGARAYSRQRWEWTEMREAVELALVYAEHPESLHWQRADALVRGYAMQAAHAAESRIASEIGAQNLDTHTRNAETYRAFAEGRL